MELTPMESARLRRAVRIAAGRHLYTDNVGLVDAGFPSHDGVLDRDSLAVRVHVREKLAGPRLEHAVARGVTREVPPTIEGFPTDVLEGAYRLHFWGWPPVTSAPRTRNARAVRRDPLEGGISISASTEVAYGTLGAKVVDRATGATMLLSNWHVLVTSWSARPGQLIYQPGRLDGGTYTDAVARLARDAMNLRLDAAVATLTGARTLDDEQVGLGGVSGVGATSLGMVVTKSGRGSDVTTGEVTAVDGVAQLTYAGVPSTITNVVTIDAVHPYDEVSAPGDSGSLWCDGSTLAAVALHFAGGNQPERALALDLGRVLDALGVDLAL